MLRNTLLILSLLCVIAFVACNKSEPAGNSNTTAPNINKPAASMPSNTSSMSMEKVGVPECDDFIAKYDACVSDKVPAAARAQYKTTLAQWRKSWHDLAANPQTKATLAAACKQAAESAKTSMKSYQCTF